MMGHRQVEQAALFYEFSFEKHIPADHLVRSICSATHTAHSQAEGRQEEGFRRPFVAPDDTVSHPRNPVRQASISTASANVALSCRQRVVTPGRPQADPKEGRKILSKWGNDLRQTFRTIAAAAGVSA